MALPGTRPGTWRLFRRPVLVTLGLLAAAGCIASTFEYRLTGREEALRAARLTQKPVLWKLELGPALIEEMRFIASDRLLVGLKRDDIRLSNLDWILVDTSTGGPLWRHSREDKEADYSLVVALEDLLLFRVDRKGQTSLLALDGARGTPLWSAKLGTGLADLIPLFDGEIVVAVEHGKGSTRLAAYRWKSGAVAWTGEIPANPDAASNPHPKEENGDVLLFTGGVARISGTTGREVWTRNDIRLTPDAPPPESDGEVLYVADAGGTLHALDPQTGKSVRAAVVPESLSKVTSIILAGDRIYLRGPVREKGGGAAHGLAAVRARDGAHLWTFRSVQPTVSNIVEEKGRVFAGTPSRIVVLDGKTGEQITWDDVTTTGRTFPVRLLRAGGRVVFVSEMFIAAYDPSTGRRVYSHGVDPISQMTSLNGLDVSIQRIEADLKVSQVESQSRMNQFQTDSALANQRKAASQQAREKREASYAASREEFRRNVERGEVGRLGRKAEISRIGASIETAKAQMIMDRTFAMVDFQMSMMELSIAMEKAWKEEGLRSDLIRQKFYRRAILASSDASQEGDYLYRPHHPSSLMGIKIVHLPTGRADFVDLSAAYLDYGIWNLVDFRKGVVYHHGIGMDPSGHVFCDPIPKKPLLDGRQYKSYLIAQPIALRK